VALCRKWRECLAMLLRGMAENMLLAKTALIVLERSDCVDCGMLRAVPVERFGRVRP